MSERVFIKVEPRKFTASTVAAMLVVAFDPRALEDFRKLALMILGRGARSQRDQIRELYQWVSERVGYLPDPAHVERVEHPKQLAASALFNPVQARGDCDDSSALCVALCHSIGIQTRLVLTDQLWKGGEPSWHHVHCEAWDGRQWLPMEAAYADRVEFGKRVAGFRVVVYPRDLPESKLFAGQGQPEGLGFVTDVIVAGAGILRQVISGRVREKVQEFQIFAAEAIARAEKRKGLALQDLEEEVEPASSSSFTS